MTHGKAWLAICGMGNRGTNFEVRGHLPCALMLRSGCDNRSKTGVAVANPLNIQSKDIQIIGMYEPLYRRRRGSRLSGNSLRSTDWFLPRAWVRAETRLFRAMTDDSFAERSVSAVLLPYALGIMLRVVN
jgi:hypothetical protein